MSKIIIVMLIAVSIHRNGYSQNTAITGKWTGARLIPLPGGAIHTDSTWIEFKKDGTVGFKHQKYEFNGPTSGTYTFQKNVVRITITKFPFSHTFEGNYDTQSGLINGLFKEIREKDPTQPAYYIPGMDTGAFTLYKNP
jgi:hypothetical protein